jgi:hypothetical protein
VKLPNAERALIDARKLTAYSLDPEHDEGGTRHIRSNRCWESKFSTPKALHPSAQGCSRQRTTLGNDSIRDRLR